MSGHEWCLADEPVNYVALRDNRSDNMSELLLLDSCGVSS